MAPVLILVLIGWAAFIAAGAAIARARCRPARLGAVVGLGAGLAAALLGVFGLGIGAAGLLVLALMPPSGDPARY